MLIYLRLCPSGKCFTIPKIAEKNSIFHEIELGVLLGKGGFNISK